MYVRVVGVLLAVGIPNVVICTWVPPSELVVRVSSTAPPRACYDRICDLPDGDEMSLGSIPSAVSQQFTVPQPAPFRSDTSCGSASEAINSRFSTRRVKQCSSF